MLKKSAKIIIAYITLIASFIIMSFWTYWGINEAFHEGWYHTSILQNLFLTFVQYLSVPIIILTVSIVSLYYKKIGIGLFVSLGIFSMFFFNSNAGRILIFIPIFLFALGFYYGEFKHKKIISYSFIIAFLLIILCLGIPQLIKVENRFNDYNFNLRVVEGNDINLTWAPQGVGFPLKGTDWQTAKETCEKLNDAGLSLNDSVIDIWRLPTREEIVRSLTRKNINAGGVINEEGIAKYEIKPDKETPLWNPNSQIIYYWTSEAKNEKNAYLVAYNGFILDRGKTSGADYQGYRCVKSTIEKFK